MKQEIYFENWSLALITERYCQGVIVMCIPFICRFVGLPNWDCVVCWLVVFWLKHAPFSFLLVSPFTALSESCIVLFRRSCAHWGYMQAVAGF